MVASTIRATAVSAAFLFLIGARPTYAATPDSPSAESAATGSASSGADTTEQKIAPPEFKRGRPPSPAQLDLLHQSLEENGPRGVESRPRYQMIIAGLSIFSAVSSLTIGLTALGNSIDCAVHNHISGCGGERMLYIPVVGPLIHIAQSEEPGSWVFGPILVVSSLAQLTGLTLMVVGAVVHEKVPITASHQPQYSLTPYLSLTGGGMQALVRY